MNGVQLAPFDVSLTAKKAWSLVKGVKLPFFLALIVCTLLQWFIKAIFGNEAVAAGIGTIITMFVMLPLFGAFLYMGLQRVRGIPVTVSQLFHLYKGRFLLNTWLYYLVINCFIIIEIGVFALLLMIPVINIIAAIVFIALAFFIKVRFSLGMYYIFDKNESAVAALKHSFKTTKPYAWKILVAYLIVILAYILGVFTFFIGLIWTVPFVYIFLGEIYQIIDNAESRTEQVTITV